MTGSTETMPEAHQPAASPRRSPRVWAIIGLLGVGAALAGMFYWRSQQTYHLATVREGVLYRDGSKSIRQFSAALDRVHPKMVVSLVDDKEMSDSSKPQLADEAKLCEEHGARLERISVKLGGWPSSDDIQRFLRLVSDKQNQPVLVHCAQGVRRTAFFVAAFQESVLGYDRARAKDAILTFGHSDRTINDIRRFIDEYDPKAQTLPADLGAGTE